MGIHLALKNNTDLLLDGTSFETYKLHNFSLNHFQIRSDLAKKKYIPWYEIRFKNRYIDFILNKIKPILRSKKHIVEKSLSFDQAYLAIQ